MYINCEVFLDTLEDKPTTRSLVANSNNDMEPVPPLKRTKRKNVEVKNGRDNNDDTTQMI